MARIAILAEEQYEELELHYPKFRLREDGHEVHIVAPRRGATYQGKHGYLVTSDRSSAEARAEDYDAVIIPGGYSPDLLRRDPPTLAFVKGMWEAGKPVGTICHGGLVLAAACDLKGRTMTGFFAIEGDLERAGARFVDEEVVVDGNLVSSRMAEDLPSFSRAFLALLAGSSPAWKGAGAPARKAGRAKKGA